MLQTAGCNDAVPGAVMHENELLAEIPGQLRTRIVSHVLQDVLQGSQLFSVGASFPNRVACPGRVLDSTPPPCVHHRLSVACSRHKYRQWLQLRTAVEPETRDRMCEQGWVLLACRGATRGCSWTWPAG